jgi:pSer/pThr/pTyr-binding forkhead associated (FHA) protein
MGARTELRGEGVCAMLLGVRCFRRIVVDLAAIAVYCPEWRPAMTVTLISLDFQAPVCETTLGELPSIIGSGPTADVRIEHCSISRAHCRIDRENGQFVVEDLDSVHGTFVDGTRIRRAALRPGCQLAIGLLSFLVQSRPEAESVAPVEESQLAEAM